MPLLNSLQAARLQHRPLSWTPATLSRSAETEQVSVPAGTFEVEVWSALLQSGPTRTFYVEKEAPHRVVKWESSEGERAELLGSDRMKYWQMKGEGQEAALEKLGLSRRPLRTP